jgi:uncharacterized RDD family membrane protein YckC
MTTTDESVELEYVGFWPRVWASLIDTVLVMLITAPLAKIVYGKGYFSYDYGMAVQGPGDFLITFVLPAVAIVLFWSFKHATPGKMMIGATIVDEKTGGPPALGQHIIRYLGYFISIFPVFLGLVWVAFDKKKQGWHDKMAGTVVVRRKRSKSAPVRFGQSEN